MLLSCDAAATAVSRGDIIAYPTEAIYGLGCSPHNTHALEKLVNLKSRSESKGLILVASQWQQLLPFVQVDDDTILNTAMQTWPGPVTWLMPASPDCPTLLTGGRGTIAVRISDHPVVRELCECCEHALVSTSANMSGQIPLPTAAAIDETFAGKIAGIVSGSLGGLTSATSIFDARTGAQLR